MKLEFIDWKIRLVSSNAMQYDNNAWKLELTGELPEGWSWEAMLANGENMDIIPLDADGTGASALLTAENLSLWGDYAVQVRGKNGDVVRHTNKIHAYIPNSLSGDAKWPELPTAFSRAEERITAASEHPPVPGENGCWMIWDVSAGAYRQSDVPVTVAPVDRTADMTQPVGRDQDGRLWTAPGGGGGGDENAVRYTAQELDDAQKAQARENIGAGTSSFSGAYHDLSGKPTIPDGNLGITGSSVGQIAKITAVDADGKPTAWESVDMPDKLPNPNALTFTGAVKGSYDGSMAVSVEIPSAVTDDHINSLIDTKLGVIENGAY